VLNATLLQTKNAIPSPAKTNVDAKLKSVTIVSSRKKINAKSLSDTLQPARKEHKNSAMQRNTAKICKHVIKKKLLIASKDITEETTLFLQNVLNVSLISAAQKPTHATRKTLASALKSGSVDFVNANLSMTAKATSTA